MESAGDVTSRASVSRHPPGWGRLLSVEPGEWAALLYSCAYFFCLLSGYYILRPVRDAFGAAEGAERVKWRYLINAGFMLVSGIAFAAIAARLPRRRFIPIAYRFFALNIVIFFILFRTLPDAAVVHAERAYYIWVTVFNLFIVSVFWSFMADVFTNAQGRRLFGFIAVGGTLGQVCGSLAQVHLAERVGADSLLLVTAVLLEAACLCVRRLHAISARGGGVAARPAADVPLGGGALAGLRHCIRSPYLLGISLFILCYTISSTFLFFTKLQITAERSADPDARVAFLAGIDTWTGVLTILAQVFLTSRVIARLGVGLTLGVLPAVTVIGFSVLAASVMQAGAATAATALVAFEAVRRASNYAFSRPAREVLFTVIPREDKYKAKNLIDTFVYRTGDVIGAWGFAWLLAAAWATGAVLLLMVPLSALWLVLALVLGRRQRALATAT